MRALGAALVDIVRALLSYVVPFRWETSTERPASPADLSPIISGRRPLPIVLPGDVLVTYTRWELRRGRVRPVSSRTVIVHLPHPNCRCSIKPIADPVCTCGHRRSEHAYVVVDGPCGARSDGCQKFTRATGSVADEPQGSSTVEPKA